MSTRMLITDIGELVTNDPSAAPASHGAPSGGPGEAPAGLELSLIDPGTAATPQHLFGIIGCLEQTTTTCGTPL